MTKLLMLGILARRGNFPMLQRFRSKGHYPVMVDPSQNAGKPLRNALLCLLLTVSAIAQTPQSEGDLRANLDRAMNGHNKGATIKALISLNDFYSRNRRFEDQAEILKQILDFWSADKNADPVGLARCSVDLGEVIARNGDPARAEPYFRSAIEIYERAGPMYQAASTWAKRRLAGALKRENKLEESDQLLNSLPAVTKQERVDKSPQVLHKREPEYSDYARKHFVSGFILLSLTIDEDGHTQDIQILSPLGFGLDQNAVKAVKDWECAPAMKNGSPVSFRTNAEVNFRLY